MPDPDLTAELDAAEAIVVDGATVEVQWGVHRGSFTANYGDHEKLARTDVSGGRGKLIRRTVTYGPWEEVPADG